MLAASPVTPDEEDRVRAVRLLERASARPDLLEVELHAEVLEAYTRCLVLDPAQRGDERHVAVFDVLEGLVAGRGVSLARGLALVARRQLQLVEGQPAHERLRSSEAAVDALRDAEPSVLLHALRARASDAVEAGSRDSEHLDEYAEVSRLVSEPLHHWFARRMQAGLLLSSGQEAQAELHSPPPEISMSWWIPISSNWRRRCMEWPGSGWPGSGRGPSR